MGQLEQFHREMREFDRKFGPEDYYDRRLREKREAEERERRQKPKPQLPAQQQSPAERKAWEDDWTRWGFEVCEKYLIAAMGKGGWLGDIIVKKAAQVRNDVRAEIATLRRELGEATAKLQERLTRLPLEVKTWEPIGEEFEKFRHEAHEETRNELRTELQAAVTALRDDFNSATSKLHNEINTRLARLPLVKEFQPETVYYTGDCVICDGATWQARRDTGQKPGHPDWILLAAAGRSGIDGRTPRLRGLFSANERYKQFDIIEFDGTSYIAIHDNPGVPGIDEGWKILARRGGRGPAGETGARGQRGARGPRGEAAPSIVNWVVDPVHYRVALTLSDGKAGPVLDLRPLFVQFQQETT